LQLIAIEHQGLVGRIGRRIATHLQGRFDTGGGFVEIEMQVDPLDQIGRWAI